jgi:hypothetical protein
MWQELSRFPSPAVHIMKPVRAFLAAIAEEAIAAFASLVKREDEYPRLEAVWALADLGSTDERAVTALTAALDHLNREIRSDAAEVLAVLGRIDDRVVKGILASRPTTRYPNRLLDAMTEPARWPLVEGSCGGRRRGRGVRSRRCSGSWMGSRSPTTTGGARSSRHGAGRRHPEPSAGKGVARGTALGGAGAVGGAGKRRCLERRTVSCWRHDRKEVVLRNDF